jgi:hypothetical protein
VCSGKLGSAWKSEASTFESLMDLVLIGLSWKICLVYLDDVIVHAKDFDGAVGDLRHVFSRLRNAMLKLNPKKCELFQKQVFYLGHVISEEGIAADPHKVSSILSWPVPRNKKELQSFLGLCSYYRKFIRSFADMQDHYIN